MCFISSPDNEGGVTSEIMKCDSGWHSNSKYCYLFVSSPANATTANDNCKNMSAMLTSVWSKAEHDFISGTLSNVSLLRNMFGSHI